MSFSPSSVDYGTVFAGETRTQSVSIRNSVPATLTLSLTGTGFSCPEAGTTVPAGGSVTVTVTFSPTSGQSYSGSLELRSDMGMSEACTLSGAGTTEEVSVSATSLAFGDVLQGQNRLNSSLTVTSHSASATPISVEGDDAAMFSVTPSTAAADSDTSVTVTYSPSGTGAHAAQLTIGSVTVSLSGTGVDDAVEEVTEATYSDNTDDDVDNPQLSRFRLFVPTKTTEMTLGQRYAGSTSTYDGFGVNTDGYVFLNAKGATGTSQLWLQAQGNIVQNSVDGSVYSLTPNDNVMIGKNSANIFAEGGVLIAGGNSNDAMTPADGGDTPPDISGVQDVVSGRTKVAITFAAWDAFVAAASAVRGMVGFAHDMVDGPQRKKIGQYVLGAGAVVSAGVGAGFSAAAAGGSGPFGGTTIYGEGGVLLGSPSFSGFYSAAGLVMMSVYPFLAGIESEVYAVNGAALTGGFTASVQGGRSASVHSDGHVKITAGPATWSPTRALSSPSDGTISLNSKAIHIGAKHTVGVADQCESIALTTLTNQDITVDQTAGISMMTTVGVKITVGANVVEVKPDGLTITVGADKLTIDANGIVAKSAKRSALVQGTSNAVSVFSGGVAIKGAGVKLM